LNEAEHSDDGNCGSGAPSRRSWWARVPVDRRRRRGDLIDEKRDSATRRVTPSENATAVHGSLSEVRPGMCQDEHGGAWSLKGAQPKMNGFQNSLDVNSSNR
jgi:hypothetical protein